MIEINLFKAEVTTDGVQNEDEDVVRNRLRKDMQSNKKSKKKSKTTMDKNNLQKFSEFIKNDFTL